MKNNRVSIEYEDRRAVSYGGCDGITVNKDILTILRADRDEVKIEDLSRVEKITFTPELALTRFASRMEGGQRGKKT